MTNKTLSDEINYITDNKGNKIELDVDIEPIKKHLQEFKEDILGVIDAGTSKKDTSKIPKDTLMVKGSFLKSILNTQMQKHFGDKLLKKEGGEEINKLKKVRLVIGKPQNWIDSQERILKLKKEGVEK